MANTNYQVKLLKLYCHDILIYCSYPTGGARPFINELNKNKKEKRESGPKAPAETEQRRNGRGGLPPDGWGANRP